MVTDYIEFPNMQGIKEIKQDMDNLDALKLLAAAYSDVASGKLKRIRTKIEQNRAFVLELSTVFHIIKSAADKQKVTLDLPKAGVANLLLTSNHRFYGGLENRLLDFYLAHLSLSHGDNFVIGRTGELAVLKSQTGDKFEIIKFEKDLPSSEELNDLTKRLLRYQNLLIYHTRMQSVLVQRSVITEVGGLADLSTEIDPRLTYYIFEPEIKKMVEFFDAQVTKVLLEQAFLESELARTAARLVSMETAQTNSDLEMRQENKMLVRAEAAQADAKMQEIMLGIVARNR